MKSQKTIPLFLKHTLCVIMFLGIVLQSSSQTIAYFLDIEIEYINTNGEEENEEEHTENKLKDPKIELITSEYSLSLASFSYAEMMFEKHISILDFPIEIQIPPPEILYNLP